MLYAIIIITAVLLIFIAYKSVSKDKGSADNAALSALYEALKEQGFSEQKTSYCTKFKKDTPEESIEIEFSNLKKSEIKIDIDVYPKAFKIAVPDNVPPGFFEHIVFRNLNKLWLETQQTELLPKVESGGYFTRSTKTFKNADSPDIGLVQATMEKHQQLLDEFQFVVQADLDQDFFKNLVSEQYKYELGDHQMLVRFTKFIGTNHASIYYIKALNMLFLAVSPAAEDGPQEDFKDSYTQLHHFHEQADDSAMPTIEFPTIDLLRQKEKELVDALEQQFFDEAQRQFGEEEE